MADYTVAAKEIGSLLAQLADRSIEEPVADPDGQLELENQIAMGIQFAASIEEELGPPTGYTCPNCNGALMAVGEATYRCQSVTRGRLRRCYTLTTTNLKKRSGQPSAS